MKKIIILSIFFAALTAAYAAPKFTKINEIKSDTSNPFFPLVTGQKWEYSAMAKGTESKVNWIITGTYLISDSDNYLSNAMGYKVENSSSEELFYLINHDGFICRYENTSSGDFVLKRLLPASADVDYNWISDNTTFIITEITDSEVRVEFIENSDAFSGYNLFRKNIGPSEMYIYDIASDDKDDYLYVLQSSSIDRTIQSALSVPSEEKPEFIEEIVKKEEVKVSEPVAVRKSPDLSSVREISRLERNYYYIQVGSFVVKNNAVRVCGDLNTRGFNAVVFEDADSLYKVLIEGDKDMENNLRKARNEINSGAFMKKRL